MRLKFTGNIRSASIVAAATLALGVTSALAANPHSPAPSPSTHGKASPAAKASAKPSESPESKPTPSQSPGATPSPGGSSADTHGACVSKVARDHSAVAANSHGKVNHGAAVSKAAHDCPKGGGGGTDSSTGGSADQPDAAESPEPQDSESPETGD